MTISRDQTWLLFLVLSHLVCGRIWYRRGYGRGWTVGHFEGAMYMIARAVGKLKE